MTTTVRPRTKPLVARDPAGHRPPSRRGRPAPTTSTAKNLADQTSESAQHVASTAVDHGQQVARGGAQQARKVIDTSRQQAAEVAQELSDQARGLLDEARAQLRDQAETQVQRLAEGLHRLGDEAQALAEGRPQEARTLRDYVDKTSAKLDEIADDLESKGAEGLWEDLQTLARSHPGSFLLAAGVAGLAVGRLVRSAAPGERQPSPEEPPVAGRRASGGRR
jgi:exonuclease VII large subunit